MSSLKDEVFYVSLLSFGSFERYKYSKTQCISVDLNSSYLTDCLFLALRN